MVHMGTIKVFGSAGSFAENKDVARNIRNSKIVPALERGESVTLDFSEVDSATQSFIHALISELIRKYGIEVLDRMVFLNCNETVRKIITIVTDYMQERE